MNISFLRNSINFDQYLGLIFLQFIILKSIIVFFSLNSERIVGIDVYNIFIRILSTSTCTEVH